MRVLFAIYYNGKDTVYRTIMQVINSDRLLMHALSGNVTAIIHLSRINDSACTKVTKFTKLFLLSQFSGFGIKTMFCVLLYATD